MPGISPFMISHSLNVNPMARPVKQKKRKFAIDRVKAVKQETKKFFKVDFIQEVHYPDLLLNMVKVKKTNGKWRMCVDFTDLNKACLKDNFPLSLINRLVDASFGHKVLSFIGAFSSCNLIMMNLGDQKKTIFITKEGLYYYKVMSFSFKNAGATYQ